MSQLRTESIPIPDLGESLNYVLRQNGWLVYKGVKSRIGKAMLVAKVNRIQPFTRPVELQFSPLLGPRRRKLDVTNYVLFAKICEDWLVQIGVLRGDTSEYVKGMHIGEPQFADDGVERMLVRIVELDLPEVPVQPVLELIEQSPF